MEAEFLPDTALILLEEGPEGKLEPRIRPQGQWL